MTAMTVNHIANSDEIDPQPQPWDYDASSLTQEAQQSEPNYDELLLEGLKLIWLEHILSKEMVMGFNVGGKKGMKDTTQMKIFKELYYKARIKYQPVEEIETSLAEEINKTKGRYYNAKSKSKQKGVTAASELITPIIIFKVRNRNLLLEVTSPQATKT